VLGHSLASLRTGRCLMGLSTKPALPSLAARSLVFFFNFYFLKQIINQLIFFKIYSRFIFNCFVVIFNDIECLVFKKVNIIHL
jgi:hypothetical protein